MRTNPKSEIQNPKAGWLLWLLWLVSPFSILHSPFLLAQPAQPYVNVQQFGARGDGVTDSTAAMNAALASGARNVWVPYATNKYVISGPLVLPSNTRLSVHPAAMIWLTNAANTNMVQNAGYRGNGATNLWLEGGIWHGNGSGQTSTTITNWYGETMHFWGVTNLVVRDVRITNSLIISIFANTWENIRVEGVDYQNQGLSGGGLQLDGPGRNAIIRDQTGTTTDDFLALNAGDWPSVQYSVGDISNVVIDGVNGITSQNMLRLLGGTNLSGGYITISNVTVQNVTGRATGYGIEGSLSALSGGTNIFKDIKIRNFHVDATALAYWGGRIENLSMEGLTYRRNEPDPKPAIKITLGTWINAFRLHNCYFTNAQVAGSWIDNYAEVDEVILSDVQAFGGHYLWADQVYPTRERKLSLDAVQLTRSLGAVVSKGPTELLVNRLQQTNSSYGFVFGGTNTQKLIASDTRLRAVTYPIYKDDAAATTLAVRSLDSDLLITATDSRETPTQAAGEFYYDTAEGFTFAGGAKVSAFKLTTAPTAGYVLTADANGAGTWQPATGTTDTNLFIASASGRGTNTTFSGFVGIGRTNAEQDLHITGSVGDAVSLLLQSGAGDTNYYGLLKVRQNNTNALSLTSVNGVELFRNIPSAPYEFRMFPANSGLFTVGDSNTIALGTDGKISKGTWNATAISSTNGGTGLESWTTGDLLYSSSGNTLAKRAIGSTGQTLTVTNGAPAWMTPVPVPSGDSYIASASGRGTNTTFSGFVGIGRTNAEQDLHITGSVGDAVSLLLQSGAGDTNYYGLLKVRQNNTNALSLTSVNGVELFRNIPSAPYEFRMFPANSGLFTVGDSNTIALGTDGNMTASGWIKATNIAASKAVVTDSNQRLTNSPVTSTELGYVAGVTSALQTQLDGKLVAPVNLATQVTGTLPSTNGGTGQASWTTGDLLYSSSGNTLAKRAIGSTGQTLTVTNGAPAWMNQAVSVKQPGIEWAQWLSATNVWNDLAYGNGLFVAVAQSGTGNRVQTSPDGINWTSRTSASDNNWNAVCYGNGLFVAVAGSGTGTRVMTSPDGITWTTRTSAEDNNWIDVAYGNGTFVAVTQSGLTQQVMSSPDGVAWTLRAAPSANEWYAVTYGNGLFVAVSLTGTGTRVMSSPDGITWTTRTSADDKAWYDVSYGNGLFVAVAGSGTGTRVMTSPDGITWTSRTSAADSNWRSVTYGRGLFVAVAVSGTGQRVMSSSDGITWALASTPIDRLWNAVQYGNGVFVALGYDGITDNVMVSGGPDVIPFSSNNTLQGGLTVYGTATLKDQPSLTSALASTNGGTGQASWTTGDILYSTNGNTLAKLGIGTVGQALYTTNGLPAWLTPAAGGGGSIDGFTQTSAGDGNTAIGNTALDSLTATAGLRNAALGADAGTALTTGDDNVAIGWKAMDAGIALTRNVAIGVDALGVSTDSEDNVAVGYGAMSLGSGAYYNVAIGKNSLSQVTTGTRNTAVGFQAIGSSLTTGANNVAVGADALKTTTASDNTAIGTYSLDANTSGIRNTALGYQSLSAIVTANDSTAVGYNALLLDTGGSNTAVGSGALDANTSGARNVAIGLNALGANIIASDSTAIGYIALRDNTATGSTAVGAFAMNLNTSGARNTAVGYSALQLITTANDSTAVGYLALNGDTGGSNIAIGSKAGDNIATGASNIIIGMNVDAPSATGNNQMSIGNLIFGTGVDGTGTTVSTGNVGIGTNAPTTRLWVQSDNDTTTITVLINTNQANITASDTFIDFRSQSGSEGSIAGTASAGVLAYNTFTASHFTTCTNIDAVPENLRIGALLEIIPGRPIWPKKLRQAAHIILSTNTLITVSTNAQSELETNVVSTISTNNVADTFYEAASKSHLWKTRVARGVPANQRAIGVYLGTDKEGRDMVASIGTCVIWVCSDGGDIDIGDFLQSSSTLGCAQKQADGVQYNYTVAKATEIVSWAGEGGQTKKRISCILVGD